jgi:hypothetical protein
MGLEITWFKAKPGYHYDYLGFTWGIGTFTYFCYKVYKKEPFYAYDAIWLFLKPSLEIPKR